jgi:hypothetical protein
MKKPPAELEGTWEEVTACGSALEGHRVRVVLLDSGAEHDAERPARVRPADGPSTARSLLQFSGTWVGEDLEQCLAVMYANRGKARA